MAMAATKCAVLCLCVAVASGFAPSRPGGAAPAARRDGRAAVAVAAAVESLSLSPIAKVGGVVRLPGSKSLSNRALLIAALCEGETTVENLLASDDTERMLEAPRRWAPPIWATRRGVTSSGALKAPGADLFLGNAGTAMRPLAAVLAALGCDVECTQNGDFGGCPPVVVKPGARVDGGVARVSGKTSSQFLSAPSASPLLATTQPLVIEITDELISQPYVQLTVDLMAKFGVVVDIDGAYRSFTAAPAQKYTNAGLPDATYFVEGDASSASYFLAAAAMTGGDLTVETERMKAIVAETTKLGADVFEGDTHCVITPPAGRPNAGAEIETYDDHRIAMTFALAACAGVPVTILDPKCTSKTFPTYFDELARVTLA
ncbi:shikimate 3-dehydrogenase [Aureococcus anophagefferens]|nr:shikimate 3-dehydrogenase [Aureococcus anophagefferens]